MSRAAPAATSPPEPTTDAGARRTRGKEIPHRFWSRINGTFFLWALAIIVSIGFLWSAIFGPQGILSLFSQRGDSERLEAENARILKENQDLRKEIYLLRTSPDHIQKTAREELGYIRKGEKVYIPPEEPAVPISEPDP